MVNGVGVEVKIGGSRRDIAKQLERYACHDVVKSLVLATADAWPMGMSNIGGKPLRLVSLTRGWL